MDFGSILKMMGGGKANPALEQLMIVGNMLNSLPKEEQTRVITNFVDELKKAVEENKDAKANRSMKEWAKEVARCEMVLIDPTKTKEENEKAEWKIENIIKLYSIDPVTLMEFFVEMEKAHEEIYRNI